MTSSRNQYERQTLAPLVAIVAVVAAALFGISPVGASSHTDDPAEAAGWGAAWLAAQVEADGSVEGGFDPVGDAALVAIALASAGTGGDAFDRAVDYVVANAATFVDPYGLGDDPGRIGRGLMVADLAGIDPTNFGGIDLPARLAATLGTYEPDPGVFPEPGLYGSGFPGYDGVFRQALALQGLAAIGTTPPPAAVDWIKAQQCPDGIWTAYRADTAAPCPPPDLTVFSGPETNASAAAVLGLLAVGSTPTIDPIPALRAAQNADGGFPYILTGDSEPNSTGLAIQAFVASGIDPATVTKGGPSAMESLFTWQFGCEAAESDRGAWFYPLLGEPHAPSLLATADAIPAAAATPPPQDGPVDLGPTAPPVDCSQPTSTTTTSTTEAPTSTTPTTESVPTTAAAEPTALTPTFTG